MHDLKALINSDDNLASMLSFSKSLAGIQINNITSQSSLCSPGTLFVAQRGATPHSRDGHDYIEHALQRGASAVIVDHNWNKRHVFSVPIIKASKSSRALALLCEAFWEFPSRALQIIGITGTNGKTSTSFMLHSILKVAGFKPHVMGTLGMGDPGELIALSHTTMDAEFMSKTLARMQRDAVSHVILEVSSHGLVLNRVSGLRFAAVGLSNISQDHLDFHGSMANYIKAKQKLFDECALDSTIKIAPLAHAFERSVEKLPNFFLYDPKERPEGLMLPGDFQINNAALACALAQSLGIKSESIELGLRRCGPIPGRLQMVKNQRCKIFIDYAHTPDALATVLRTVRKLSSGRVILVFGCGGDRDQSKRPLMGRIAEELADLVIITDDNPRSEDPEAIRSAIGLSSNEWVKEIACRKEAIKTAISSAGLSDIVLIAGRGHEEYQIYNGKRFRFSDYDVALELVESL